MNVKEIVEKHLKDNGYKGLIRMKEDGYCYCRVGDIFSCECRADDGGSCECMDCEAACLGSWIDEKFYGVGIRRDNVD